MNRAEVERAVIDLLCSFHVAGAEAKTRTDYPLGRSGFGFDSLTLVQFVTAVENCFELELPDLIWRESGQISVLKLVDIILETQQAPTLPPASSRRADEMLQNGTHTHVAHSSLWSKVLRRLARTIRDRKTLIIMSRDLSDLDFADIRGSNPFALRELRDSDLPLLNDLWDAREKREKLRLLHKRTVLGSTALIAARGSEIVGIDWISPFGEDIPELGLSIRTHEGTCYGYDLHEKYPGQGIGMALLQYSLAESKLRGFRKQVTYTTADNLPMLGTAIRILGFKRIGMMERSRFLLSARWHVHEQVYQDASVLLSPD